MSDFKKYANESLMKEVLPVVDNLERALAAPFDETQAAVKGLRDGVEMTLKGLLDTLDRFGVVAIDALGKPFDPNYHQAVSQEASDQYDDDTVCQELQKGYILNDRLLRPSMVIVSKRPANGEKDPETESMEKGKKINITVH
jgi:molecular chaperone GrpE